MLRNKNMLLDVYKQLGLLLIALVIRNNKIEDHCTIACGASDNASQIAVASSWYAN
jgi:hypothetical protein